jgi:hypothetical protein
VQKVKKSVVSLKVSAKFASIGLLTAETFENGIACAEKENV